MLLRMVRMFDSTILIEAINEKELDVLRELIFTDFYNNTQFSLINYHFMLELREGKTIEMLETWLVDELGYDVEPLFEF